VKSFPTTTQHIVANPYRSVLAEHRTRAGKEGLGGGSLWLDSLVCTTKLGRVAPDIYANPDNIYDEALSDPAFRDLLEKDAAAYAAGEGTSATKGLEYVRARRARRSARPPEETIEAAGYGGAGEGDSSASGGGAERRLPDPPSAAGVRGRPKNLRGRRAAAEAVYGGLPKGHSPIPPPREAVVLRQKRVTGGCRGETPPSPLRGCDFPN
jgi:hypothetical protein